MMNVSRSVVTSANVSVRYMPVMPNRLPRSSTPMIVIIRALDIDISADTGPLPYAVKKPDANILKPQSKSAIDRYLVPASAISNS